MHDGSSRLAERLASVRARYPASAPEMVADVVQAVLATMSGDLTAAETSLLAEVEALGRIIATAKAEIAALQVDDITVSHIPFATDELDAIVAHTASATDAILASCETLDAVSGSLSGDTAARLRQAITHIYEACSFQDITGQRITKVVTTLKTIEAKVAQITTHLGAPPHETPPSGTTPAATAPVLLNGPQQPHLAMDQSDIDKLLASFE